MGHADERTSIEVPATGLRELNVSLPFGACIKGRVHLSPGQVPGRYLVFVRSTKGRVQAVALDDQGEFAAGPLRSGEYRLLCLHTSLEDQSAPGLADARGQQRLFDEASRLLARDVERSALVQVSIEDVHIDLEPVDLAASQDLLRLRGELVGSVTPHSHVEIYTSVSDHEHSSRTCEIESGGFEVSIPSSRGYLVLVREPLDTGGSWYTFDRIVNASDAPGAIVIDMPRGDLDVELALSSGERFPAGSVLVLHAPIDAADDSGQPFDWSGGGGDWLHNYRHVAIPPDGLVSLTGLPARKYSFRVDLPGRPAAFRGDVSVERGQLARATHLVPAR